MDPYPWLRLAHLLGLMLMAAGLIGVFVADMRARQVRDLRLFARGVSFVTMFYDGLVVPGALLLLASGTWLIVAFHTAAALYHHFVRRDGMLQRMWPARNASPSSH